MMVIKAETMGFCMGVRKALSLTEDQIDQSDSPLYTFGPLIHNSQVIESLEQKGVTIINSPLEAEGPGRVVIRAHGVVPQTIKELKQKGFEVFDGTCPRVGKSQKETLAYSNQGYFAVLAGDKGHGEIVGLEGYCGDHVVISTAEEALELDLPDRVFLNCQTTFDSREYEKITGILREKVKDLEVCRSICPATDKRQNALAGLRDQCDAIIVIGGKNSANTRRLYDLAAAEGFPAWHIETADQIPETISRYKTVGLTAGASTPDWIIDEVETALLDR